MAKYLFANNASTTLGSAISATATSITVTSGSGAEFPSPAAGQYFSATMWAAGSSTGLPNEIVYVMSRSGDTMTVLRAQEGTTAQAWNVGDTFANYPTAGYYNQLVSASDLQSQVGNSAVDSGTVNAGAVTLSPAPSSLAAIRYSTLRIVKGSSPNTGAFTLNVNGFGAVPVTYQGLPLAGFMIRAGIIYEVVYDGTSFELLNPFLSGVFNYADFRTAGTFNTTAPAWSSHADVQIVAGGGGGGGAGSTFSGGGGGAGEFVFGRATITPNSTLTITVGAAGTGGPSGGGTGGAGGGSSIGGIASANGGGGGASSSSTSAGGGGGSGAGGSGLRDFAGGTGGDGNSSALNSPGGNGAAGPFGGSGRTGAGTGVAGTAAGAGGGGCWQSLGTGGAGAPGAVLIMFLP